MKLRKMKTERNFQELLIKHQKEVKANNTIGKFKKQKFKTNSLCYSMR